MREKIQKCKENITNLQVMILYLILQVLETISDIIVDNIHESIQKNVRETVFSQKKQNCVRRERFKISDRNML